MKCSKLVVGIEEPRADDILLSIDDDSRRLASDLQLDYISLIDVIEFRNSHGEVLSRSEFMRALVMTFRALSGSNADVYIEVDGELCLMSNWLEKGPRLSPYEDRPEHMIMIQASHISIIPRPRRKRK